MLFSNSKRLEMLSTNRKDQPDFGGANVGTTRRNKDPPHFISILLLPLLPTVTPVGSLPQELHLLQANLIKEQFRLTHVVHVCVGQEQKQVNPSALNEVFRIGLVSPFALCRPAASAKKGRAQACLLTEGHPKIPATPQSSIH